MILIIISIVLLVLYGILLLLYAYGWWTQKAPAEATGLFTKESVTVIIPARNEADNIQACIRSILLNDFPEEQLELIVINDCSTDDTAELAIEALGDRGRVLQLEDYLKPEQRLNAYKKKALELAISQAKGSWIVTTDADCVVSPQWLRHIIPTASNKVTQLVAAPVSFIPYKKRKNCLYYFQSLDFMTMQGITAASARLRLGNMCNGANLAFRKSAFESVGGYQGIDHIASGDDMLLMAKIQRKFPDGIVYHKHRDAIVHTPVQASWSDFLNQRIRWSSKAGQYQEKRLTIILTLVYFFNLIFIPLLIAGIFQSRFLWIALYLLLVKIAIELFLLIPVARFYNKTKELFLFPLLQPAHIIYIVSAGFLGKFGHYKWKGRIVK